MNQIETTEQYLEYIRSALATISVKDAVASYDTGYGLHVVCEHLGDECHAMDVIGASILKIRTPNISGEAWYVAWTAGCELVHEFCKLNKGA